MVKKRIFKVLFIAVFAAMLGLGIISPLMPIFSENLGANGVWLGIIFSSFAISRGIFMPIIGKISDKKGRKRFITIGLFIYTIVSLLYLVATDVYTLTIIRLLHGLASAMVIPIAMAYVGETIDKGKEGSSMGAFNISLFMGMGMGPFIGGFLHDMFGMASVFYAMSALSAIAFFTIVIFLPDINYSKHHKKTMNIKKALENNIVKGLILYRVIGAMGRGVMMSFLPVFASAIHINLSQIGTIISANIFIGALLQLPFGKLADKYNKFNLIITGSIIGSLPLLFIPFTHNFWDLLIISSIMGAGGALSMPAASAIVVKVGHKIGMGSSMGIFNTAMSVGMISGPLISGVVMDTLGVNAIFYTIGAISFAFTPVFYYFFKRGLSSKNLPSYL